MRDHARIEFVTDGPDADERLVRTYVLDAVSRLRELPACDRFAFVRAGQSPSVDGGLVIVDVYGDPERVVDRERDRWDALVADGVATDWRVSDLDVPAHFVESFGERGAETHERLRDLAGRLSALVFEEFDEPPAPVDAHPGEDAEFSAGWWTVLHLLSNHQAYPLAAEMDANLAAIRANLRNLAGDRGAAAAGEKIDELVAALESTRAELGES